MVSIDDFVSFPVIRKEEKVLIREFELEGSEGHSYSPFVLPLYQSSFKATR